MLNDTKPAKTLAFEGCDVDCQRFGKHRNGLQRFRCPQCKCTYTEPHQRTLGSMYIPAAKATLALQLLLEGNSIMRLLVLSGERCAVLLDSRMRNVRAKYIQADEIWCYVAKKDKHVRVDDPEEFGN